MMFPVISLLVITVLTSFELTGGVTSDENIPKWANERHVTFLPPYTPIANKSADYIATCSSVHCSGFGKCYIVAQNQDLNKVEKKCHCSAGHFGPKCQFEDTCYKNQSYCQNGGQCNMILSHENANDVKSLNVYDSDLASHPQCSCPSGTSGTHCEEFTPCLNETAKELCPHYEKCILLDNDSYRCICHKGVLGQNCTIFETDQVCFNKTRDSFCSGNGECSEHDGNANCECDQGFEGESCELKVDVCEMFGHVCGGNGKCVSNSADGTWKCECEEGWWGQLCDEEFWPCKTHQCKNSIGCIVTGTHTQQCECKNGYSGELCEQYTLFDCRDTGCQNGGFCGQQEDGSSRCSCPEGWTGQYCEKDVDECSLDVPEPMCLNGATCENMPGGYKCQCMTGYDGELCQIDEDECIGEPCMHGATCVDEGPMKYRCECPRDEETGIDIYFGINCELPNPCWNNVTHRSMCEHHGRCYPSEDFQSYTCNCFNTGYKGDHCEIDVNECEEYSRAKNFYRPQSRDYFYDKFDLDYSDNTLTWFNSTLAWQALCLDWGQYPEDTASLLVLCRDALKHNETLNQCVSDGHECINTDGSWHCKCRGLIGGWYCTHFFDICDPEDDPCKNGAKCINKRDFFNTGDERDKTELAKCECKPGFNGTYCEQDLSCNTKLCDMGEDCIEHDVTGFASCICPPGKKCGNRAIQPNNFNSCDKRPCKNNGTCYNGVNEFFCECAAGFQGKTCEEEVNECDLTYDFESDDGTSYEKSPPCVNGGKCIDRYDSFECKCPYGYTGLHCESLIDPCNFVLTMTYKRPRHVSPCVSQTTEKCYSEFRNGSFSVQCLCKEGFHGNRCQHVNNPCLNKQIVYDDTGRVVDMGERYQNLCSNGGVCVPVWNDFGKDFRLDYECQCPVGFNGSQCENRVDTCSRDKCNNRGNCSLSDGKVHCLCDKNFTGSYCSKLKVSKPSFFNCARYEKLHFGAPVCKNGGKCVDKPASYMGTGFGFDCECPKAFRGEFCDERVEDFCDVDGRNPCVFGKCVNGVHGYRCDCIDGFSGKNCDIESSRCSHETGAKCPELADYYVTESLYACMSLVPPLSPECVMNISAPSVSADFEYCTEDCGMCTRDVLRARCICRGDKTGEHDCSANINLCESSISPCDPIGTLDCVNKIASKWRNNSVECVCKNGFTGELCNETNDVCETMEPCKNGGLCQPLAGDDYQCQCPTGFGCKDCSCRAMCDVTNICLGPGTCMMERMEEPINGNEYFSYCQCDRGVAGKFCAIDTKNECELDPCGNRTDASGAIVPYQCVDRIGHFECVPTSVTASTTRAPFVDRKSDETSTWTVLVGGLASVFLLAFLIILVIKGAKGTKIVVKKTFYPAGWLEIIKGNFNSRKRRRDEPAGHYEMGSVGEEGDYYGGSEYSEVDGSGTTGQQASKKLRQENLSSPPRIPPLHKEHLEQSSLKVNNNNVPSAKVLVAGADNTTSAMLVLKNRDPDVKRQTLLSLVKEGYDMNTQTLSRHETVLHQAILLTDLESVQILLQSPSIDLSIGDINNRNAIMVAAATADERVFELICRVSTRDMLNQQQTDGSTALMTAVKHIHSSNILRRLIDAGADVNMADKRGRTPLHWAAQVGNSEAVVLLINAKADRDAQDVEECTALIHAVREGCVDSVVKLLELGADRMVQNRDKQTAADIAELYENKDILHCLQNVMPILALPDIPSQRNKNNKKQAKLNKAKQAAAQKKRQHEAFLPVMHPNTIIDPSGKPIPMGMVNPATGMFIVPPQQTPPGRMPFSQHPNLHINPSFAHHLASIPPHVNASPGSIAKAQQAFLMSPPNGGTPCQPLLLTQDPSGRFFHEAVPHLNAATATPSAVFSTPPVTTGGCNITAPNANSLFPGPPPPICPISNVSPASSRQGALLLSPEQHAHLGTPKQSGDFCDSWSETVPALVKEEPNSKLPPAIHCTQASVYEEQDNYEKINYDYTTLPKVTSTISVAQSTVQNVPANEPLDFSKSLQVSTNDCPVSSQQQSQANVPVNESQANSGNLMAQQSSVGADKIYPNLQGSITYGNLSNQNPNNDCFPSVPQRVASNASSVGGYQDMTRSVTGQRQGVVTSSVQASGNNQVFHQAPHVMTSNVDFSSNYSRNSSLTGINSDYDFNNPVYQSASTGNATSMPRNFNNQHQLPNMPSTTLPSGSVHANYPYSMQNLPQNPTNMEQNSAFFDGSGFDRMYSAPNGYAYDENTAVAHF